MVQKDKVVLAQMVPSGKRRLAQYCCRKASLATMLHLTMALKATRIAVPGLSRRAGKQAQVPEHGDQLANGLACFQIDRGPSGGHARFGGEFPRTVKMELPARGAVDDSHPRRGQDESPSPCGETRNGKRKRSAREKGVEYRV